MQNHMRAQRVCSTESGKQRYHSKSNHHHSNLPPVKAWSLLERCKNKWMGFDFVVSVCFNLCNDCKTLSLYSL